MNIEDCYIGQLVEVTESDLTSVYQGIFPITEVLERDHFVRILVKRGMSYGIWPKHIRPAEEIEEDL